MDCTDHQMNWLGEQLLGYGKIMGPAQVKPRLREVTAAEIRAVARDFFRPDGLNLALVNPLATSQPIAAILGAAPECPPGAARN